MGEFGYWKKCSICKKELGFSSKYYVCNVSTCTGKRTGLSFCSVSCFDEHLPGARHRDAYAIEEQAMSLAQFKSEANSVQASSTQRAPRRTIVNQSASKISQNKATAPQEILIVASKLKNYIKAQSDMNTSTSVMDRLSFKVRLLCDQAIEEARLQGRKTVLDRDFK